MSINTSRARDASDVATRHALQCMEIWGGNEAFDNAVSVPGIDAWVYSKPCAAHTSGGDVHYASMCGGGRIARFFLADLSGHGAEASGPAEELRKLMRRYINTLNQTRFVRALNERMLEWEHSGLFATAVLTTYFAPRRQLLVCNAGHPPPLWYRAETGTWQWLKDDALGLVESAGNLPLGVIEGTKYRQFAAQLQTDDLVLIYSDSLFEALNTEDQSLGLDGLLRLVNEQDPRRPHLFPHTLADRVRQWHGSEELDDDLTIMLLHHHGTGHMDFSLGERLRTIGRMLGLLRV